MNRLTASRALRAGLVCSATAMVAATAFAQSAPSAPQSTSIKAEGLSKADKVQALKATAAYGGALEPNSLGDFSRDSVFTAVTPCRLVDTRNAGGALQSNTTRTFDADGSTFTSQGGFNGSCGVPFGGASAIAVVVHPVSPSAFGGLWAWGLGTRPVGSAINYRGGENSAETTIIPIVPGAGADFSIYASATTHVAIDVIGYFAPPTSTALDCTNVASAVTAVPYNSYTAVDAICPSGRTATGGGTFPIEGTLGRPNIWMDGSPTVSNGWRTWVDNQTGSTRSVQTYVVCCRVPGR